MTDNTALSGNTAAVVDPVPAGYTTLTPFFCCVGAARAIEFYTQVFGATVVSRNELPDGTSRTASCSSRTAGCSSATRSRHTTSSRRPVTRT